MVFLTEPEPEYGVATGVAEGVRRIVARNPGAMTYRGTNSYLIETMDGLCLLDPGPADHPDHTAALLKASGGRIAHILVSHTHHDHVGGLAAIQAATGAAVHAYAPSALDGFVPDHAVGDGDAVAGMTAIFTPGHAADHLCFARQDGIVFSADHVMSWSTSIVSPPQGDMADYFASLHRMLARDGDTVYLPGHGPPHRNPRVLVERLLAHRMAREDAVMRVLAETPRREAEIVDAIYGRIAPDLRRAAERSVAAHLLKLHAEGRAARDGGAWRAA